MQEETFCASIMFLLSSIHTLVSIAIVSKHCETFFYNIFSFFFSKSNQAIKTVMFLKAVKAVFMFQFNLFLSLILNWHSL